MIASAKIEKIECIGLRSEFVVFRMAGPVCRISYSKLQGTMQYGNNEKKRRDYTLYAGDRS